MENDATATESQQDYHRSITLHKDLDDSMELLVKQKMQAVDDLQRRVKDLELLPHQVEFQIKSGLNEFKDSLHLL